MEELYSETMEFLSFVASEPRLQSLHPAIHEQLQAHVKKCLEIDEQIERTTRLAFHLRERISGLRHLVSNPELDTIEELGSDTADASAQHQGDATSSC